MSDKQDNLTFYHNTLRRIVGSTLHFSPKTLKISKWPWGDKNDSKHPMLSMSMAYYVISCKQIKKSKYLISLYELGSRPQK